MNFSSKIHSIHQRLAYAAGVLRYRVKGALESCNSLRTIADGWPPLDVDGWNYESDDYDTADKSMQTSRHVDVFKVWLMWRAKGPAGFERQIDQLMNNSKSVYLFFIWHAYVSEPARARLRLLSILLFAHSAFAPLLNTCV
jgi:hypothetical protein